MSKHPASDVAMKPVWFPSLTIGTKLILNAAIPLALFGLFAIWLQIELTGMQGNLSQIVHDDVETAMLAKDLQQHVIQVQQFLSDVSATRAQDGLDDGFQAAQEHRASFLSGLQALRVAMADRHDSRQMEALNALQTSFETYYKAGLNMADAYVKGGPPAGNQLMPTFDQTSAALQKNLVPFIDEETRRMHTNLTGLNQRSINLSHLAIGVCLLVAAIVAMLSGIIHRSVVRPIHVAAEVALRISQGDLRHQFLPKGQDEIGKMLNALSTMQDELRRLVTQVKIGIDDVEQTSASIYLANTDLSRRTDQQAVALDETASSMQTLGDTVSRNAENANDANDKAQHARAVATTGGELVMQVESTMKDINQSSTRVSEIIGVIDNIAFQTNLLALNAAVEAARAGENGRGFAVVANEVRMLASRTTEAAHEIKELISGSMTQIERGAELVERAGSTMRDVVQAVEQVTNLVSHIAQASQEQSQGVSEAAQAVAHMDQATQRNATLVEQTAANSQALKAQAQALVQAIHAFSLDTIENKIEVNAQTA